MLEEPRDLLHPVKLDSAEPEFPENKKFVEERVELDGKAYENCEFEGCMIVLEKGETEIKGCKFNRCRLVLLGQALRIAKILSLFTAGKPLKVLDFAEPGLFGEKK